jgi:hypothetical protein
MTSIVRMGRLSPLPLRLGYLAASLLAWAIIPGCGDGKPYQDTSLNEATVTGVVKAKGEPVTEGGTILFNASNSARHVPTKSATIGPDGRYTIKTYTGLNLVTYGGAIAKNHPGVGLRRDAAEVESGENTFDFDILGEGKNPNFDSSRMPKSRKKR